MQIEKYTRMGFDKLPVWWVMMAGCAFPVSLSSNLLLCAGLIGNGQT